MSQEPIEKDFTRRTYHAGGFLLMLSGVISAIIGLGFLIGGAAGGFTIASTTLTGLVAGLFGGYVLVFAVIEFAAGAAGYRGHNWYGAMTGGVLGMLGLVTIPLDLVGVILLALGEGQFDRQ